MSALKHLARLALHQAGGLQTILWHSRKSLRILTYHGFSSALYPNVQDALSRQCAFLKQHFDLVSLSDISSSIYSGKPLPARALAVTVDDGYRDFYVDAFPVFRAASIPVTIYLITDFIDGQLWPWWNQVEFAVHQTPHSSVRLCVDEKDEVENILLHTPAQRQAATDKLCQKIVRVSILTRLRFIQKLPELFSIHLPVNTPEIYAPLSWSEIKQMAPLGIDFGAHTKTHPILPSIGDPAVLSEELSKSKDRIDQELGRPTAHFCYPNGDFDSATLAAVEHCGFYTAVTTHAGLNYFPSPRFQLKRFSSSVRLTHSTPTATD